LEVPDRIFCCLSVLPLHVQLTSERVTLSAERVYDVHCVAFGSRPAALVTWWLGNTQLLDHSTQVCNLLCLFVCLWVSG
jgi:hypothetical protein